MNINFFERKWPKLGPLWNVDKVFNADRQHSIRSTRANWKFCRTFVTLVEFCRWVHCSPHMEVGNVNYQIFKHFVFYVFRVISIELHCGTSVCTSWNFQGNFEPNSSQMWKLDVVEICQQRSFMIIIVVFIKPSSFPPWMRFFYYVQCSSRRKQILHLDWKNPTVHLSSSHFIFWLSALCLECNLFFVPVTKRVCNPVQQK